jgi:hypothetical protein
MARRPATTGVEGIGGERTAVRGSCRVPKKHMLGAAVGVMIWLWISTTVMLLGAELNAEIEHQTARDSTVGTEKPLGARGAVMADTVGAKQS